jgi:hypothetical protein
MSDIVPSPVMGRVVGFVIVRNGSERLEYASPEEMAAEVNRTRESTDQFWKEHSNSCFHDAYMAAGIPSDAYFTLIRREDNGQIEEEAGADYTGKIQVGDSFIKKFCESCKNPTWFKHEETSANNLSECSICADRRRVVREDRHDGALALQN